MKNGLFFTYGINGGGTSSPIEKAVKLNDNGLVVPSVTADPTGENGSIIYNTTSNKFRIYENGAWRDM